MSYIPRRGFLKGSTLFLCAAALQHAVPHPLVRLATAQSDVLGRPFRMLALGDSVMWGQGLKDEHKFTYLLRDWLCKRRGGGSCRNKDDVQLHVEAHSGAVIAQPKKDGDRKERARFKEEERFTREFAPLKFYGEVNYPHPTLWGQLDLARRHYTDGKVPLSEVDLLLVNGGINDLNATNILLSRILGGDLTEKANKYCRDEMARFLSRATETFPNARIVVTSYFPFISTKSCAKDIFNTLKELRPSTGNEERSILRSLLDRLRDEDAEDTACAPDARPGRTLTRMAERSVEWVTVSNNALEAAVNMVNRGRAPLSVVRPGAATPPESSARAIFVGVPFAPENAYAAPKSFLWHLTIKDRRPDLVVNCVDGNILENLVTEDEIQGTRPCMCDHAGKRNDLACVRAGTFHPNVAGANAYFEAIRNKLEKVVGPAGWVPAA